MFVPNVSVKNAIQHTLKGGPAQSTKPKGSQKIKPTADLWMVTSTVRCATWLESLHFCVTRTNLWSRPSSEVSHWSPQLGLNRKLRAQSRITWKQGHVQFTPTLWLSNPAQGQNPSFLGRLFLNVSESPLTSLPSAFRSKPPLCSVRDRL